MSTTGYILGEHTYSAARVKIVFFILYMYILFFSFLYFATLYSDTQLTGVDAEPKRGDMISITNQNFMH